jgi:hypothetical protein
MSRPTKLYHVTTGKKAQRYQESGAILSPVRGFDNLLAAMAWAIKTGRKVIYVLDVSNKEVYKLPDHHNEFGTAWWADGDVSMERATCTFSGDK